MVISDVILYGQVNEDFEAYTYFPSDTMIYLGDVDNRYTTMSVTKVG